MKLRIKPLPFVMTVLSALYLIYVISSESTTLVADAVGGDPGGKVLPTAIALFLLMGFLYITLKERPEGEKMNKTTACLFIITLILAIAYVLLIKHIGFIILTAIMLYALEYIYCTIGEERKPIEAITGGILTVLLSTGFYTLMRLLTKTIGRMARKGVLPKAFSNNTVLAVISIAFVLAVIVLLGLTLCRILSKRGHKRTSDAGIITFSAVLILFVIFKQFFLVALAPGLLRF